MISDLLGKLSQRTGREWTLADIVKLAEKFPKGGSKNIDSLLSELSNMGLDLPEETKEKIKDRMNDGKNLTMDDIKGLVPKEVKGKSSQKPKPKPSKASGKSKHMSLAERIRKLSGKKKRKS